MIQRSADRGDLFEHVVEAVERELGRAVAHGAGGVGVGLDEQGVDTGGGGGTGEQRGAVASAPGLFARTRGLGRMRDVKTDGGGVEIRIVASLGVGVRAEFRAIELHQIAQADEVVDEAVVAEEGAAFDEQDVVAAGLGEFAHRADHLAGREKLALLDTDGPAVLFRGLTGGGEQVGLSAEEGGDLEHVDDGGGGVGLVGGVDIRSNEAAQLFTGGVQPFQPAFEPRPAGRGNTGTVGLVERGLEDERQAEAVAGVAEAGAGVEAHVERLEHAGAGDDSEGSARADVGVADGAGAQHGEG